MSQIEQKTAEGKIFLFDPHLMPEVCDDMFEAKYWLAQKKITGQAIGRGVTTFFKYQEHEYVLRHYRRGGLIGKVVDQHYFYTGLKQTRAYLEMSLLNNMWARGLSVPQAAAARIVKKGLFYCADIILTKIPQAEDVFSLLKSHALNEQIWQKIGQQIRHLHQQQVYHHDLNIHNIMLDNSQHVWLIDFDKCALRSGENWKQQNLQRLYRSLCKEKAKNPCFYWQPLDWQHCIKGYENTLV